MGDKAAMNNDYSLASDSGVATSTNTTLAEPASSPPETATGAGESQDARAFDKISKGILGLSNSSQTESASADAEDGKWTSSVSSSNTQQPSSDVSLSANSTATVDADQESSSLVKEPAPLPGAWKNEVPTLDSYQSARASPTLSQTIKDSEEGAQFTVGPPNAVPYEEEDVESTSEMIVQQPEMPLTGDAKKDRNKIMNLETRLRDALAKVESLKKELEMSRKEKEESERQLKEAKEKIKRLKTEGALANAAVEKKYEDEIADLKKKIADLEKEKSEQKAEYCKQIEILRAQLKDQEKSRYEEVIQLMCDKHALEIKVEKMNTNEEKLNRKLSEAKLEAANLRYQLEQRENTEKFEKEIAVLRSESADALKKKEDEIEELRRQISQNSLPLDSSQSPGAENKDGVST